MVLHIYINENHIIFAYMNKNASLYRRVYFIIIIIKKNQTSVFHHKIIRKQSVFNILST